MKLNSRNIDLTTALPALLIGLMHIYINRLVSFPTGILIINKVLNRLSLFDIIFPFVILYFVFRYKGVPLILKKLEVIVPVGLYISVIILLMTLHHQSEDIYYWTAQIYAVLVYLFFYAVTCMFNENQITIFGRRVYYYFVVSILSVAILSVIFRINILWEGNFYKNFLPVFMYRLQLLADPDRLGSYFLFISFCTGFYLIFICKKNRKKAYGVAFLFFLLSLLVRGRTMPFIFLVALIPIYLSSKKGREKKTLLFGVAVISILALLGLVSTVVAIFPLQKDVPFLNFKAPSQYFVLHKTYFDIYMNENKIYGNGYVRSSQLYPKYVDEKLEDSAIKSYELPKKTIEEWVRRAKPPHNTYIRILVSGGIVWLFAWLIVMVYPVINGLMSKGYKNRDIHILSISYFVFTFVAGYFDEIIHYVWFWAGTGIIHGVVTSINVEEPERIVS